jgi:cytochrome c-type biogenesis protein CcmH/NrfG
MDRFMTFFCDFLTYSTLLSAALFNRASRMHQQMANNYGHLMVAFTDVFAFLVLLRFAGKSAFALGKYDNATKAYRKASELNPNGSAHWLGLTEVATAQDVPDLAIEANTHLVRQMPRIVMSW